MDFWYYMHACGYIYTGHVGREMQSSSDRLYVLYLLLSAVLYVVDIYILHGFELIISFLFSYFTKPSRYIELYLSCIFLHTSNNIFASVLCYNIKYNVSACEWFWKLYFKQWLDKLYNALNIRLNYYRKAIP